MALPLLLSACSPSSSPVAQISEAGCASAFEAIKPQHALKMSDAAVSAAVATCEYARIETQSMNECLVPIPAHAPGGDTIDGAAYGLRASTMAAVLDAEFYGYDLAAHFEKVRTSNGARLKSEQGCLVLLDEYPRSLASREAALRALGKAGGY